MVNSSLKHAVAVAVLAGASVGANATVTDLGEVKFDSPTAFTGIVLGNGAGINDVFQFTLEQPNVGSGYSAANVPLTFSGGNFDTILSTISLLSYGDDGLYGTSDDQLLASSVAPGGDSINLTYDQPLTGPAYINVTGLTAGAEGGIYAGAIGVSPVPEPESFAMLLAGLGLMGAVVRRRSMNKTA